LYNSACCLFDHFFKIDIYIYTIYKKSSLTYWNVSEYDSQQLKIKEVFS